MIDDMYDVVNLGNGFKAAEADDDEHISLAPQRSSFLSGCQVKRSAAGPDNKRDGSVIDVICWHLYNSVSCNL